MCLRVAQNFVLCSFELGEARPNERTNEEVRPYPSKFQTTFLPTNFLLKLKTDEWRLLRGIVKRHLRLLLFFYSNNKTNEKVSQKFNWNWNKFEKLKNNEEFRVCNDDDGRWIWICREIWRSEAQSSAKSVISDGSDQVFKMGLLPLEFSDCLLDSPYFRENLRAHEKQLDQTATDIKGIISNIQVGWTFNIGNALKIRYNAKIDLNGPKLMIIALPMILLQRMWNQFWKSE